LADTTVGFHFEVCPPELPGPGAAVCPPVSEVVRDNESALIRDLRAGDGSAYEKLIDRFEQPVFNLVSRVMDDPADAADVVQEVFLKIFRNIASFRRDSSLKTWIYRIAVNEARNHRRWFSRHRRKEVGLDAEPGETRGYQDWLPDPGRSPYETALNHETHELIEAALAKVNPRFRAALVLREIEGLSYEEISEILDISLGTVKSRILRGRDALRKHLADQLEGSSAPHWSPQLAE
jgi:RNA polymerase sigma-70 factor (ECF subfamily)